VFDTIADRAEYLRTFLSAYADLARTPVPRPELTTWSAVLTRVSHLVPFRYEVSPGELATSFDRSQVEQVLINLVKNAVEAGSNSDDIMVRVSMDGSWATAVVSDRGPGMTSEALAHAMMPFYSTKPNGSGLGLALCLDLVEAHGGTLCVRNRPEGGLEVRLRLPA